MYLVSLLADTVDLVMTRHLAKQKRCNMNQVGPSVRISKGNQRLVNTIVLCCMITPTSSICITLLRNPVSFCCPCWARFSFDDDSTG